MLHVGSLLETFDTFYMDSVLATRCVKSHNVKPVQITKLQSDKHLEAHLQSRTDTITSLFRSKNKHKQLNCPNCPPNSLFSFNFSPSLFLPVIMEMSEREGRRTIRSTLSFCSPSYTLSELSDKKNSG